MQGNALDRIDGYVVKLLDDGRDRVGHFQESARQYVQRSLRRSFAHFQMQVRSSRRTPVARQPDALAALDRKAGFGRGEVEGERFAGVLQLVDVGFDRLGEALQVAVYRHPSVGVSDVERLAESARRDVDARDIAVVHGEDGLADHALRLDVDPRVEMASAQFAVVGRQPQRNIQRRSVADRLSAWRRRLS